MKFRVPFKTPDTLDYSISYAVQTKRLEESLEDDEVEELKQQLYEFANKWIDFGEVITVEFDTAEGTATLVKKSRK